MSARPRAAASVPAPRPRTNSRCSAA
jgi:hypothetical protein